MGATLEAVDWHAVRLHFAQTAGDSKATAEAFGIKVKTLQKRAERGGWMNEVRKAREIRDKVLSVSVAKTSETLASMAESFKLTTMKGVNEAAKSFFANAKAPENWQEMKLATDIAAKVAGFGQEQAVSLNFLGGISGPGVCREVDVAECKEDAQDVEAEVVSE